MLHPDLQKLLDFALESGEVTEKHRHILHNKAILLNQDIDELEMIIEGEIRRLKKSLEGDKQKNYACPNCGASIPASAIKCGFCNFEVTKSKAVGENYIDKLNMQLQKVNDWHAQAITKAQEKWWGGNTFQIDTGAAQQKATVISTFTMPTDKEHLLEFFYFCHGNYESNYDSKWYFSISDKAQQQNTNIVANAFRAKAQTAYEKLKRFVEGDEEIKSLVTQYRKIYDLIN
jgi:hypothetical protein